MELSRVSTTTVLFLFGGAKLYRRTSPRAILPATPPPLPIDAIHPWLAAASNNLRGHALPGRAPLVSGGVPAMRRAPMRNGSVSSGVQRGRWPARAFRRARSGRLPYVDSIRQYTRQQSSSPAVTSPGNLPRCMLQISRRLVARNCLSLAITGFPLRRSRASPSAVSPGWGATAVVAGDTAVAAVAGAVGTSAVSFAVVFFGHAQRYPFWEQGGEEGAAAG